MGWRSVSWWLWSDESALFAEPLRRSVRFTGVRRNRRGRIAQSAGGDARGAWTRIADAVGKSERVVLD